MLDGEEFYGIEMQFYVGYKSARNIKDLGIRHKQDTQIHSLIEPGISREETKVIEPKALQNKYRIVKN